MDGIIYIGQGDYARRSFGALVRIDGVIRNARIVDFRGPDTVVEFANGEWAVV